MYNLLNNYNSVILYAQHMVHVFLLLTPLSTRGYGMEAKPQCSSRRRDWPG